MDEAGILNGLWTPPRFLHAQATEAGDLVTNDVEGPTSPPANRLDMVLLVLLGLASLIWASRDYAQYWADSSSRWTSFYHDRHAHCAYAMDMADALRTGNVVEFAQILQRNIVWPPIHGFVAALAMLATGLDHRTVVFPAVLGWWLLLVSAPLTTRAIVGQGLSGWIGAGVTWLLLAQSPAYRAYSTDCLLEGLGAGISAWCVYAYVLARQQPTAPRRWLLLGVSLTLLFFEKTNYWLVVVAGLLLAEGVLAVRVVSAWQQVRCGLLRAGSILREEARHPVFWLGMLLAGSAAGIALRGPTSFPWQGQSVSLYPPGTFVLLAYVCFFARGWGLAWRRGWHRPDVVGPAFSSILKGHIAPIAISFLIPKRLMTNIWFLSPVHYGESNPLPLLDVGRLYAEHIVHDYHTSLLLAVGALMGLLMALGQGARLRAGGIGLVCVVGLAAWLVWIHPNQKPRFLHSWFALSWVLSGAGVGLWWSSRWPVSIRSAGLAAGMGLALFGMMQVPPQAPMMVDQQPGEPIVRLSDWYLSELGGVDRVAVLSTQPDIHFFQWTIRERFGSPSPLERDRWLWWPMRDPATFQQGFDAWVARTSANRVVVIDVPPSSSQYRAVQHPYEIYSALPALMEGQQTFRRVRETTWAGCRASIWERAGWVARDRSRPQ
jgi:hypothetical protein